LQTVFISCYFFDVGLYFPKASLIAFYWWLIPQGFRRLRIAVYVGTAFVVSALVATVLTDSLIAPSISYNWYETSYILITKRGRQLTTMGNKVY
jgi:hypothetical protein